jgi:RimJ/RimL family protein N-acetyltransferase/uncharacterized damage-inducible protein DinB
MLTTERLLLRPFDPGDEDGLWALWNEPEVARYLWDGRTVSRETVKDQIRSSRDSFRDRGYGHFTAALRGSPETTIGFVGLRTFGDADDVEILYAFLPVFWKRGLAGEAARAVLRFGFETAKLEQIFAGADPPNRASFRVMERLGMTFDRDLVLGGRPARYYRIGRDAFLSAEQGHVEDGFRRLFAYNHWANLEALRSLAAIVPAPPRPLRIMAHIIGAEWLWLCRLEGRPSPLAVWPELAAPALSDQAGELRAAWEEYLADLSPSRRRESVAYVNSKGERWESRGDDVLTHVVLHSAYHRGQVASEIRSSGHAPAYTDFIHCIRQGFVD